jgi:diaminohydroxyphosphoribosylaminopyrimidine deaminase/5-amino-6-(5-phosphoribosylamino)uracil reductase
VLKWAQSLDGRLAYAEPSQEQRWISNEVSRRDAHKLRRRVGAIVVGINTVLEDNPLLTPRPSKDRKPSRIVLDSSLKIPLKSRLLRTAKTSPVVVYARRSAANVKRKHAERITKKGAEVLAYEDTGEGSNLHFLIEELSRRGVQQVLVEGGPRVLTSFLKEGLADEVFVYVAPTILGAAGAADLGTPMTVLERAVGLRHVEIRAFGDDVRLNGVPTTTPQHR